MFVCRLSGSKDPLLVERIVLSISHLDGLGNFYPHFLRCSIKNTAFLGHTYSLIFNPPQMIWSDSSPTKASDKRQPLPNFILFLTCLKMFSQIFSSNSILWDISQLSELENSVRNKTLFWRKHSYHWFHDKK